MIKIPAARANAAEASFPTLVDDGNVFLSMRRTHAKGGSKSATDGNGAAGGSDAGAAAVVGGCFLAVVDLLAGEDSVVEAEATAAVAVGEDTILAVGELMVGCVCLLMSAGTVAIITASTNKNMQSW